MLDADRFKLLFGPYRPRPYKLGTRLVCAIRGRVRVVDFTTAPIPWPVTRRPGGDGRAFLIVCGGLARAVRRESAAAVIHWWGVSPSTLARWRRALGVPVLTEGTKKQVAAGQRRAADALRGTSRIWTPEQDAALGTASDRELAIRFGRKKMAVRERRRRLGIPAVLPMTPSRDWTAADGALLGTMQDKDIAVRLGITTAMVLNRRRKLNVPAFANSRTNS
jgi:hypothetical protein